MPRGEGFAMEVPDRKIYLILFIVFGECLLSCGKRTSLMSDYVKCCGFILKIIFAVIVTSSGGDSPSSYWDENYSQPYFDNSTKRDITATIGQTSLLHCRVRNLGDRAVSEEREREWGE